MGDYVGKGYTLHSLWIALNKVLITSLYFLTLLHTPIKEKYFERRLSQNGKFS